MNDNVRNPEVLDDVRSHVDLPSGPVSGVIQNHSAKGRYVKSVLI